MFFSQFLFLSIGGPELILIVLVVILLFGAKKIPELARMVGKGIYQVKNITSDIQREINNPGELKEKEIKHNTEEVFTRKKKKEEIVSKEKEVKNNTEEVLSEKKKKDEVISKEKEIKHNATKEFLRKKTESPKNSIARK